MENQFNSKSLEELKYLGNVPSDIQELKFSGNISSVNFNTNELTTTDNNIFCFLDSEHLIQLNNLLSIKDSSRSEITSIKSSKYNDTSIESYLKKISVESSSIDDFLLKVLQHKNFKNFETVFLFVHSKGELSSTKHEVSTTYKRQSSFNVKEFNHFFQSIKKSKNRSFGQSELKGNNFNILGTFIAREFALTYHNIIFIISRNDFLSPTEEELNIFQDLSKSLPFFLNTFLYNHLETFKNDLRDYIDKNFFTNFNENMVSLNEQTDIFHTERLTLLGELLNTLRHELSNPLFGLQLSSQILQEDFANDPENLEFLEEIIKNIIRSQEIIKNFSELFVEKNHRKLIRLDEIIEEVITLTKSETRGIIKEVLSPIKIETYTNPTFLVQVLFNLIINSAQEMHKAQIYLPKIKISLTEDDHSVFIDIIDNGPGIDEHKRKEIFKPFFTTKEKGTGLGLPISLSIIEKLNGGLTCEPSIDGAHFRITLPRSKK